MSGSYEEGKAWAATYDTRAAEILRMVTKAATAAHGYALILQEIGYNHDLAEHSATMGAAAAPARPAVPLSPAFLCRIPLPSAGGPGSGLLDSGLGLVEKIGLTVPDGNATTISNAADTWDRIRTAADVAGFPAALEAAAVAFDSITAPESAFIDEDLRAVKAAAETVLTATGELAASCREHREALDELRENLRQQLVAFSEALLTELAINAAVAVASSWITLGASIAIGVAGAAAIAARYARPMRLSIEAWKQARNVRAGVKMEADLARHVREMERLEDLTPAGRLRPKAELPKKVDLSAADTASLRNYTGGGYDLNACLRNGTASPDQLARAEQINQALAKLPDHVGPVTRRVDLPPDVLAKYQPGEIVVERQFISSSSDPARALDSSVEMQIISKTGKEITPYSKFGDAEGEVLFKTDTPFEVVDRFRDPTTGRTIIQMRER
jgi:hypothetical protein